MNTGQKVSAVIGGVVVIALVVAGGAWLVGDGESSPEASSGASSGVTASTGTLILDPKKSYGNEYADGIHYVMTQDFPYSPSCFRGTATRAPGTA